VKVDIKKDLYASEKRMSEINRETFAGFELPVINMIGSPGSGKTTLLEATLEFMKSNGKRVGVIEGDIQTSIDSERLEKYGMPVVMVNTGGGCHLSADDIMEAAQQLPLDSLDLLIIENVGNLVCPAAFDLGESMKIAVLSTPEGDEKPLKYPALFRKAHCAVISKAELADVCRFDMEQAKDNIRSVNADVKILPLSVFEGTGMEEYFEFVMGLME
jgi:hydrogenase nickel incorporation protein HypB